MKDQLYHSVVRTIAFFDIFDHSLTDRELFEYLHNPPVKPKLDFTSFVLQSRDFPDARIAYTYGLWHLVGREALVPLRTERSVHFEYKLRKLKKAVRLFSVTPFVRGVFVCNTLAFNAADSDSDIDVLVIVKLGRMWIARLWTTIIMSAYRLRRTKKKITNRICLSFYLADRALNLSKFRIAPDDVYFSYWIRTLIPVYDPDQLGDSILRANRELLEPFLPHARHVAPTMHYMGERQRDRGTITGVLEYLLQGSFGDRIEEITRSFQRMKIMRNSRSLVHAKDTRVVVNDSILKFHENDRRARYRDEWFERLEKMGIPNYSN